MDDSDICAVSKRKVALITGASSGIGWATAIELAGQGWDLGLGSRRLEKLQELQVKLEALGARVYVKPMDLEDSASIDAFADGCFDHLGRVDVMILNAGMAVPGALADTEEYVIRQMFDVNLFGPVRLCQRVIGHWKSREKFGDLVFISSEQVRNELPHLVHYGASKVALEYIARGLRKELAGTGSRVLVMQVGATDTEFRSRFDMESAKAMISAWERVGIPIPLGQRLTPESVAWSISFAVNSPREILHDRIDILPNVAKSTVVN